MDREALVRAVRRREAQDALTFERDRETILREQIEELVAERVGAAFDEAVLARLGPEDAELVRTALGQAVPERPEDDDEPGHESFTGLPSDHERERADETEEEITRLEEELERCRRMQAALERYLALIDAPDAASGSTPASS